MKKYIYLVIWIVAIEVIATISGFAKNAHADMWYTIINKSPLTPPDYVFPIAWTLLYILIAISGWRIWHVEKQDAGIKILYGLQLILNVTWMPLFFYFKLIDWSFAHISLLTVLVGLLITFLFKKRSVCGYLLLPYFLWLTFATYLNFYILMHN